MSEQRVAVEVKSLGKMYKLYKNPNDKIKDVFGLNLFKKDYYREFWALRDINIKINKGERVGFIGHNGAGKSTLLKIITGNYAPTEGEVYVNGKIQALLEMGTGFHPDFTGRQNIRASLAYQGLPNSEINRLEEEIIDFTELGDYIEQPVRTYSAGMYSRLAFATSSAVVPELMIIDEILGAGDAYFNGKCVERMRRLTGEKGVTVLFVSHDLQSVQNLCDRVIWIDKGRIRYDGETLTGIKLYTQSVRENEELRLKIRDMKISRKQAMVMDRMSDLFESRLVRLSYPDINSKELTKIYSISVYANGKKIDGIDVGGPMDNDLNAKCHIIDEPGVTCWSKGSKDSQGFYRVYDNSKGSDKNAPIYIMYSKAYCDARIEISVKYETKAETVSVELFDNIRREYIPCEEFGCGSGEVTFIIEEQKQAEDSDQAEQAEQEEQEQHDIAGTIEPGAGSIDVLSTEDAEFIKVALKNKDGIEKNVFPFYDAVKECAFKVRFNKNIRELTISFLVYSIRGDLVISTCQKIVFDKYSEVMEFVYTFPEMKIGPGEYNISIGLYDELDVGDNSIEQKFLALFDRALSFKIEVPSDYSLNIGTFVPDTKITVSGMAEGDYRCSLLV